MKRILKKLGILAIICGVLSPFASFPKVNAANDCEYHLNQYLFLDVFNGKDIKEYLKVGGAGKINYTSFTYTIPVSQGDKAVTIESVGEVPLDTKTTLEAYFGAYEDLIDGNENEISKYGNYNQVYTGTYNTDSVTSFIHGYWAEEGEDNEEPQRAEWEDVLDNIGKDKFYEHTIQGALLNQSKISDVSLNVSLGAAKLSQNERYSPTTYDKYQSGDEAFMNYVNLLKDDVSSGLNGTLTDSENFVTTIRKNNEDELYFNVMIERNIKESDLEKLVYGYHVNVDGNDQYRIYTMDEDTNRITESYQAWLNITDKNDNTLGYEKIYNADDNIPNFINVGDTQSDDETSNDIVTYYWPVMYNVEYSVCSNTTTTPATWTLKYKEGVKDTKEVTNMPSTQTAQVGTPIVVSDKKPSRSGYAFNGWKVCNGTDTYKAGDKVENTEPNAVVELCAQWGEEGPGDDKKLGVVSYIIGFAAVGAIAGGIYLVSKKKNLFKQI